jgi:4-amino-4-deoxy-L-arabinose transferase-like glycosyltransferase
MVSFRVQGANVVQTSTTASAPRPAAGPALALILGVGLLIRLGLAAAVPLTTDEAYYVDWARHLQPGYLDHPPAVAWLMAGALRLLGNHAVVARLPAILLQALTTLLAASLVGARAGERAALAAALLLQAVPVFSLGAVLMTPDAPLALAWVGTLWAVERALSRDARWLLAAGLFLGFGLLSKLTAGLLGLGLLAGLLASRQGRALLATPWPWAGAGMALLVASPFLAWNAANGWPSFLFQARHGMRGGGPSAIRLLGSLGAQAAYVSPVVLALAAVAAWRGFVAGPVERVLACTALPVVLFFTTAATFTPGALPHWPGPGWLSATLLLAMGSSRWLRLALSIGAALTGLLVAVLLLLVTGAVPLPASPLDELRGWGEGAAGARAAARGAPIAATHWMALGHLGWAGGVPVAYAGARPCGASLYAPDPLASGRPLLLVEVVGLGEDAAALAARVGPLTAAGEVEVRDGQRLLRRYRYWLRERAP